MTPEQENNETVSIETFVVAELHARRPAGTDVATTHVILAACRAAATMAPRTRTGEIDADVARQILDRAVEVLHAKV